MYKNSIFRIAKTGKKQWIMNFFYCERNSYGKFVCSWDHPPTKAEIERDKNVFFSGMKAQIDAVQSEVNHTNYIKHEIEAY